MGKTVYGPGMGGEVERAISFYVAGPMAVGDAEATFIAPTQLTLEYVEAAVGAAPTGAALRLDILVNGVTVFTHASKPEIADGAVSGKSAAPDVTTVAAGDRVTLAILQVGATTPGSDLAVSVVCH